MPLGEKTPQTLVQYLRSLRRQWWLVALVMLITVGVAAAYSLQQPTIYRASMTILVELPSNNTNAVQPTAQTMSELVRTHRIAIAVGRELGLRMTGSEFLDHLHVETNPDNANIEVQFDDADANRAQSILDQVRKTFLPLARGILARQFELSNETLAADPSASDPYVVGPVQPTPVRTIGVALVLGVLLGLMAGLVRELFDDTLREVEEAEEAFGAEAIATLPPRFLGYRPLGRNRRRRVDLAQAELAIQRLAANILWSPHSRQSRTLLVTSANPEEGKTTVAAHLAVGMASTGHRVVAVDTDLRRPMLHHYLGMEASRRFVGLDAVIRGSAPLSSAVVDVPLGNRSPHPVPSASLRAILASPSSVWPAEVGPDRIAQVLEELTAHGDYVILDSPPLLVAPDGYPLVSAVDTVVLVIRSGKSTAAAVAATRSLLERLEARRVEMVVTEVAIPTAPSYRAYASPRPPGPELTPREGRVQPT